MKFPIIISLILASASILDASQDILNFKNNDTLHGEFVGFDGTKSLLWKNQQAEQTITFNTSELRKVVFNQGLSRRPFLHSSLLTLSNGDILPCSISEITDSNILVHTDFADDLRIPKKHVTSCILNPLGQQILYQGPYLADNWELTALPHNHSDTEPEAEPPSWEFGNFGWYNRGVMGGITLKDFKLPEAFRLRYQTESPRHSNIAVIINADLKRQKLPITADGSPVRFNTAERITSIFGSCLAIKLGSHNATLASYTVSENGDTNFTNIKAVNGRTSIRRDYSKNTTEVEIRVNRPKKVISLYYQKQLVNQWSLRDIDNLPQGTSFGFLAHYGGDNYLTRVSEISIAPWNGVLDSASSLESETQDIVMLSNGKDRFAGKVLTLENQQLSLDGTYAKMVIPRNELQSINFASDRIQSISNNDSNTITFQFTGSGSITATPLSSDGQTLNVNHPILGNITLKTEYLSAITYGNGGGIIDQWNSKID
jgi:hypothetical protein